MTAAAICLLQRDRIHSPFSMQTSPTDLLAFTVRQNQVVDVGESVVVWNGRRRRRRQDDHCMLCGMIVVTTTSRREIEISLSVHRPTTSVRPSDPYWGKGQQATQLFVFCHDDDF